MNERYEYILWTVPCPEGNVQYSYTSNAIQTFATISIYHHLQQVTNTYTIVVIVPGLPCSSPSHLSAVTVLKESGRTVKEERICFNMEWWRWEEETYQEPYVLKFSLYVTPYLRD